MAFSRWKEGIGLWNYKLEDYMAHSLTFSEDGSKLAVTSSQGNVLLFIDAKNGRLIRKWGDEQNLEANPDLIAFSADGQQFAYGIQNAGGIHFASWPKVEPVISGGTTPSSMRKYAVSNNGRILVCLQNHRLLTVWDLVQGTPIRNIQLNAPGKDDDQIFLDLELSPDAGTAYVQSFEELRAVNTVSGAEIWRHSVASTIQDHSGAEQVHRNPQFTSLSLSNDGKVLLSLLSDGPLRCWEARTGRWLLPTKPGKELQFTYNQSVLASPDGKWAAVSGMEDGNFRPSEDSAAPLRLIDVTTQLVVREIRESHGSPMQFSPNGKTLLVLEHSGQLTAYDTQTLKRRWRTPRITIGFFESGNKLLCVESDGKISERSVSSGKILKSWPNYSRLGFGAVIQKLGPNRIIGVTWNHTLGIWDLKTHRKILDLAAPANSDHNSVNWLAYTPDNFYNGSVGVEKFLRWRTGTKLESGAKWQSQFRSPEKVKAALAFTP